MGLDAEQLGEQQCLQTDTERAVPSYMLDGAWLVRNVPGTGWTADLMDGCDRTRTSSFYCGSGREGFWEAKERAEKFVRDQIRRRSEWRAPSEKAEGCDSARSPSDRRARDAEEDIEVLRGVPLTQLHAHMALGELLPPSVQTCVCALAWLREHGMLDEAAA